MSDATRTQIGIVEETTINVTPATPAIEILRITSATMAAQKDIKQSQELAADGLVRDRITTGFEATGEVPQEGSYGAQDTLLRGYMRSEWIWAPVRDNHGTAGLNITAATATDLTVLAGSTTQYLFGTVAPGHLTLSSGFASPTNNGRRRAGTGTTATDIKVAGAIDASPAAAARIKVIGFQGVSGDITAAASGLGSTALDFTTLSLVAGMWVYVGGPVSGETFATAAVRGWCRIAVGGVAATTLTFDVVPTGWTTDAGSGKTISVYFGDYMRQGTTRRTYTVEQQFQDLTTPTFEYFTGQMPSTMEWTVTQREIITTKSTFIGMNVVNPATSRFAGATDVAAPTNDVMNASSNVGTLLVNGAALVGNFVTSCTLKIDTSARRNNAVGSQFSANLKQGQHVTTATLEMYYDDSTVLTFIRNSTAVGFVLPINDPTGTKGYIFDMPRMKFGDGSPSVPGINQDRMLATDFQAIKSPTFGYAFQIQRTEAFNV